MELKMAKRTWMAIRREQIAARELPEPLRSRVLSDLDLELHRMGAELDAAAAEAAKQLSLALEAAKPPKR